MGNIEISDETIKEIKRLYYKNYRANNKDRLNDYQRTYRANNKDKVKKYNKTYWINKAKKQISDN